MAAQVVLQNWGLFRFLTVFSVVFNIIWSTVVARDQTSNLESVCLTNDPPSLLPNSLRSCVVWRPLPQYGYHTMSRELLMIGFARLWLECGRVGWMLWLKVVWWDRDGKTYKLASNACVKLFLAWVKSVPNFTLFCCERELCREFTLFWVILMAYNLVNL